MEWLTVGVLSALWFGLLTSISPCPLATNLAAMSYVGKSVGSPRAVLVSGLLYTLGRVLAYVALGIIVIQGLLSIPGVARFLERYMNLIIGPLLIIVSLFLLGMISFSGPGFHHAHLQRWADKSRLLGPILLGAIFALTLCPVSAGLFFGSLVPLSIKYESSFLLPLVYGVGTGLPVIAFAVLLGFGARSIGKVFNKLTQFEHWARRATGAIFLLAGVFLIYRNFSGYVRLLES